MLGEDPDGRETLVEHAGGIALRRGKWKYIPASNDPSKNDPTATKLGIDPAPQLYDLDADPGEIHNLAESHREILDRLSKDLAEAQRPR
jgi:arylsulfatase A-like enzyme